MLIEALTIILGIILQVFIPGYPKETLLIQSGLSFGLIEGALINWLGMILAAQVGYEVTRRSIETGGRYLKLIQSYENLDVIEKLQTRGNSALFFMRLIPYSPNDILSLVSGTLKLPRKGFILVSIVTALPYAVIFAYIGTLGRNILKPNYLFFINSTLFLFGLIIMGIRRVTDQEGINNY